MKKLIPYVLLIFVIALFILVVLRRPPKEPFEKTYIFFDTFVRISFYPADGTEVESLFPLIEKEFERIQHRYGYGSSGLPAMLADQKETVVMTQEDIFLLKRALKFSEQTGGAFDITVGLLQQLWGFKEDNPHLPQEEEIVDALRHTGCQHMAFLDGSVRLKKDMIIDLGGISKGYAVDRVVHLLKEKGIAEGLVDAGGDLRIFGSKPDGSKWVIGIKHPKERGTVLGTFEIDSGAVATSGDYERSFIENGTRYHHIIDPRTGYPALECISVTILANDAVTADAFATGVFVLGPEKGMQLVEDLAQIEAVIAYRKNGKMEIVTSRGIRLQ